MFHRIVCLFVLALFVALVCGCWGPFQLSSQFNQAIDKFHDSSGGGTFIVQALTFIPVIPWVYGICMFVDYVVLNPINLFTNGYASDNK